MTNHDRLGGPGIYRITNTKTGSYYLGAARDIYRRWYVHRSALQKGEHPNPGMRSEWTGDINDYEVEVVERCGVEDLPAREAHWLANYVNEPECLNCKNAAYQPPGASTRFNNEATPIVVIPPDAPARRFDSIYEAAKFAGYANTGPVASILDRGNVVTKGPRAGWIFYREDDYLALPETYEHRRDLPALVVIEPSGWPHVFWSIAQAVEALQVERDSVVARIQSGKPATRGPLKGYHIYWTQHLQEAA